ncbi:hypothetical protein BGZ51_004968 [Haplosporangium sp. Z 767]|nr:hypothetical protein BGZ51_004968 [Haplosporangium sp. Z 767]
MPKEPRSVAPATSVYNPHITPTGSQAGDTYKIQPETIIHFPDLNPSSLTLLSFAPPPPSSSTGVTVHQEENSLADIMDDETDKRKSISKRMSWMSIGFGNLEKRLHPPAQQNLLPTNNLGLERILSHKFSKDSNMTLTNVINAGRREDLKEPTDDHGINKRFYRTRDTDFGPSRPSSDAFGTTSTIQLNMGMTRRAHTNAIGGIGGRDDPNNGLLPHATPQASATESAFSMTGKRYGTKVAKQPSKQPKSCSQTSARQLVGVSLMVICLLCLIYASTIYHWRHIGAAQNKSDDRYFDRIGPTALTMALFITYLINVFLTIQLTSKMDSNYQPSIFYNVHGESNASASPPIPMAPPPPRVFDMPPLPPGSTILVDEDDNFGGSGSESAEEPPVVGTEEGPSSDDANGGEESGSSTSEDDLEP